MDLLKAYSLLFFLSVSLASCGGSSDKEFTVPISHTLDGTWSTACLFHVARDFSEIETIRIDGRTYTKESAFYGTSDCSGQRLQTIRTIANLNYQGEQNTSICLAEQINISINDVIIDGNVLNPQQLSNYFFDLGISNPEYNIACVSSNFLLFGDTDVLGDDGSSPARRPVFIDLTRTYNRINSGQFPL